MPAITPLITPITRHFRLQDFIAPDTPIPAPWILDNLVQLANRVQVLRDVMNIPLMIQSAYRTEAQHLAMDGSNHSLHLQGLAVDIALPTHATDGSYYKLRRLLRHWSGGVGIYPGYIHLDIRPEPVFWDTTRPVGSSLNRCGSDCAGSDQ
jgi:hypothetical protein